MKSQTNKISNELSGGWSCAILPTSTRDINAIYERLCPTIRQKILDIASNYLGTPYRWGGKVPGIDCLKGSGIGFDCSGFVGWVYLAAGYPQLYKGCYGINAATQYTITKDTRYPLISDIVFYSTTNDPKKIHHVGIISAKDQMVNAPNSKSVIRYEPFWEEYKFFGYLIEECK